MIFYGEPDMGSEELVRALESKLVVLGGCVLRDGSPRCRCDDCSHCWDPIHIRYVPRRRKAHHTLTLKPPKSVDSAKPRSCAAVQLSVLVSQFIECAFIRSPSRFSSGPVSVLRSTCYGPVPFSILVSSEHSYPDKRSDVVRRKAAPNSQTSRLTLRAGMGQAKLVENGSL